MAKKNITRPDTVSSWIDDRMMRDRCYNDSKQVRDLIRGDRDDRANIAALRGAIQQSEASGISDQSLREIFDQARRDTQRNSKPVHP